MKTYGGTCPLCCGDIKRMFAGSDGDPACSFCGLAFDIHSEANPGFQSLILNQPDLLEESHQSLQTNRYVVATILPAHGVTLGDQLAI